MIKAIALLLACAGLSAVAASAVVYRAGASTTELDADIALVSDQIEAAKMEASKYTGGLLGMEVELRSSILKNTKAMLEQKRTSLLCGIYNLSGGTFLIIIGSLKNGGLLNLS